VYCDMTPDTRNSSFLGNSGKQVPAEMYMHAKTEPVSKKRIGKLTTTGVLLETVFSIWSVQSCYIQRVS
jgi:hypothetical protein